MKCIDCNFKEFELSNGQPNRYYCTHPEASKKRGGPGACLICRTERHSSEITIKTSPKWCPLRQEKEAGNSEPKKK